MLTYERLVGATRALARKLPPDIRGVIGIPRKGMLVATILAEMLHLPLGAYDHYEGIHWLAAGSRTPIHPAHGRYLLVDDACSAAAAQLRAAKEDFSEWTFGELVYAVAFAPDPVPDCVDFHGEIFDADAEFQEAEFLNTDAAAGYAVDLDGVLCLDPPDGETDDEARWTAIFARAIPQFLPRHKPVKAIVTGRLEKYRAVTEAWLARWGIQYERLLMHPASDCGGRGGAGKIGRWKAAEIAAIDPRMYIESSAAQAGVIADRWSGPVYCTDTRRFARPVASRIAEAKPAANFALPFPPAFGSNAAQETHPRLSASTSVEAEPAAPYKIMLAMPGGGPCSGAIRGVIEASQRHHVGFDQEANSWDTFNTLLARGLNRAEAGEITHFAMLHTDIAPEPGWLDALVDELDRLQADMISAIVPLKDGRGVTSSGVGIPGNPWGGAFRRLAIRELDRLPETFDGRDLGYAPEAGFTLLHNSGCWLADLRRPCFRADEGGVLVASLAFPRRIARVANGQWAVQAESEDWHFSRRLQELGARTYLTRRVKLLHFDGATPYANHGEWGMQAHDEQTRGNWADGPASILDRP